MWLCSINSFTNAGVLVQEMNVTPFITNSTTYPDESCAQPETAKLTTFKQTATARVQITFMFRLRMFASDPKLTANASLYLYLSDQAPPPVLLPGPQGAALTCIERLGNISHAHAGHIKHSGGGVSHTWHLCLGRDQHHLSVQTIPIHFQSPERNTEVLLYP